jgi:hypothetical protein
VSASFCAAVKTSAEGSGTHDVAAYSIASWLQSYDLQVAVKCEYPYLAWHLE